MSEENKRTAIAFIEAMSIGDGDAVGRMLTPDAVVTSKGFSVVSGTRSYDDVVGNIAAFKQLIPGGMKPKFLNVFGEGDQVVVEWEGNGVLANDVPYGNQYGVVFTFAEGRIKVMNEYFCSVLADSAIAPMLVAAEQQRQHAGG